MDQQTFELSSAEIDVSRDAFDVPAVAPKIEVAVCDGYSLSFDALLCGRHNKIGLGEKRVFFVGCFQMTTGNFEKHLYVLEIILKKQRHFCTCNYYVSNNCL